MIGGHNMEPWINGGYRRIRGYERYDGRPAPSDAEYTRIDLAAAFTSGEIDVGDTITGATSSATGVVVSINTALTIVYVTKVTGTWQASEDIDNTTDATSAVATISSTTPTDNSAPDIDTHATVLLAAENEYRDDIGQVPGTGDVRGIWQIRDRVYAIRDNAGQTAGVIHKATASGWDDTQMTMGVYLYFTSGGTTAIAVGDTLTGASSGATGTVHKVILHSGSWAGGDGAGYVVLTSVSGTYTDTEGLEVSASNVATANGASATFALATGGRYVFISENFFGGASTYRVYGCGGEGPAFEIDENDIVSPILMDLTLGDAPDENKPFLIESFDGRLWLAFDGGSVQHSIVGDPLTFNGFLGAAEYGLGHPVTDITRISGDIMVARTRQQTHGFYKDGSGGYTKKIISDRAGGILYTGELIDTSYAVDDSGITNLQRVERFGDFASATISDDVQPTLIAGKEQIAGTMVIRESNQYRILFESGSGVVGRVRQDGIMEFGLLALEDDVHCSYSCEDENGTPTYWFGGSAGYVFNAEKGRNFDGEVIDATCRLPYSHQGSPGYRKHYRLVELEVDGERAVSLTVKQSLDYASGESGVWSWDDRIVGGGGFYDLDLWDDIYWDAPQFSSARFELKGTGENMSLLFYNGSATTEPFILQGAIIHFDLRREGR